jgi:hypothetical protein
MSAGLHPIIMLDLNSATSVDRRRSARHRDQVAATRRPRAAKTAR